MQKSYHRAFTIIELLVVVSIIALLVGILLPAIGKSREQAQMTQSQGNLKNLGAGMATYAAEYADRQLTYCVDNLSTYGVGHAAMIGYYTQNGVAHPPNIVGAGAAGGTWAQWMYGTPGIDDSSDYLGAIPADFSDAAQKFGAFRMIQSRNFYSYAGVKRFYDPIFYAPKDTAVIASVEPWMERPEEMCEAGFVSVPGLPGVWPRWGSYILSPVGMVNPDVLSLNAAGNEYYTNPWELAAGWRSPSMGQATYADLKTHIIEHHWLQNRRKICNPAFNGSGVAPLYDGCQPFFFNGSRESAPVTVYYDGHIGNRGQRDAIESNQRVFTQSGQTGSGTPQHGLWSIHTEWQGGYGPNSDLGYFMEACIDSTSTSYHILTIDGIKGRDFLSK